ncbi:hypothetical protein SAMN05878482_11323 [Peribacillus simplex]|uniref:Uncharacterized protein n=1 Tax=Peribacillus simplex TaxID=1478 RepID=A0A9X8WN96_9BACI|nr:hypothetical protein [Peribacillus simplex]SIS09370.1 hypothetical protein SAMN05878482_11323 [Peribacillus simplex]
MSTPLQAVGKLEEKRVCLQFFYGLYNLDVDFRSRNSLSAGGRGASSACACGVSLDELLIREYHLMKYTFSEPLLEAHLSIG